MKHEIINIKNTGEDFSAHYAAEKLLIERGFSLGSMQRQKATGIVKGDCLISKWDNMSNDEILTLDGIIEYSKGSKRNGDAKITIFGEDKNPDKVRMVSGFEVCGTWGTLDNNTKCPVCGEKLKRVPRDSGHFNAKYHHLKQDDGCYLKCCPLGCSLEEAEIKYMEFSLIRSFCKDGGECSNFELNFKSFNNAWIRPRDGKIFPVEEQGHIDLLKSLGNGLSERDAELKGWVKISKNTVYHCKKMTLKQKEAVVDYEVMKDLASMPVFFMEKRKRNHSKATSENDIIKEAVHKKVFSCYDCKSDLDIIPDVSGFNAFRGKFELSPTHFKCSNKKCGSRFVINIEMQRYIPNGQDGHSQD